MVLVSFSKVIRVMVLGRVWMLVYFYRIVEMLWDWFEFSMIFIVNISFNILESNMVLDWLIKWGI